MDQINKNKPIPLYYQIMENIKEQINSKELNHGDKLPTEIWYSKYYDVSRVTVRKALGELIKERVIERVRGKGPVVATQKFNRQLNRLKGLRDELAIAGIETTSKIISIKTKPATGNILNCLNVDEGEPLIVIHRLRYADGQPFADQIIYLREKFCKGLDSNILEEGSLYDILEKIYNLKLDYCDQTIEIKAPTRNVKKELEIHDQNNLLFMRRSTYLDSGETIEYTENFYVSDIQKFSIRLYR